MFLGVDFPEQLSFLIVVFPIHEYTDTTAFMLAWKNVFRLSCLNEENAPGAFRFLLTFFRDTFSVSFYL